MKNIVKNLYVKDYGLRIKELFTIADEELFFENQENRGFKRIKQIFKKQHNDIPYFKKILNRLYDKIKENGLSLIGEYEVFVDEDALLINIPLVGNLVLAKMGIELKYHGNYHELRIMFYDADDNENILDFIERRVKQVLEKHRNNLKKEIEDAKDQLYRAEKILLDSKTKLADFEELYFMSENINLADEGQCLSKDIDFKDEDYDELSLDCMSNDDC